MVQPGPRPNNQAARVLAWTGLDRLDRPGPPGPAWTGLDRLDRPGPPGPAWTAWTGLDRPGPPGPAWTAWTGLDRLDQPAWPGLACIAWARDVLTQC